ncbi:HWE histidine kinase domain-containing protein [Devosia aurantiaca]|uniref:histidine kinase n=1 Tax=Devosia aurantiaca TaxID=2714858 RepID=A0A6M1SYM7_9HYPH|nr:HWE histidine kinase domain-containing protein [Devosia aurantiaca]NGP19423.1 sensor histidine kinase [Devosia aurantiaca]
MSEQSEQATHIAQLEADNQRLRRLLDQSNAPGELRHRLRSTAAMLRMIIRRSAETKRDLEIFVGHVEDRLDALMRAQSAADENGSVEIYALLTDELLHYGATESPNLTISGPHVHLQPRAGQVFGLALHELAINAVEHGLLGIGAGKLDISWTVTGKNPEQTLVFTWRETGRTEPLKIGSPGFGTEVLTRLLEYEIEAQTDLAMDTQSVVCTIRFPLADRIGRVEN